MFDWDNGGKHAQSDNARSTQTTVFNAYIITLLNNTDSHLLGHGRWEVTAAVAGCLRSWQAVEQPVEQLRFEQAME